MTENEMLRRLKRVTRKLGYKLGRHCPMTRLTINTYTAHLTIAEIKGVMDHATGQIWLDPDLEPAKKVQLWIHELAHALLGPMEEYIASEVAADGVSLRVLAYFGQATAWTEGHMRDHAALGYTPQGNAVEATSTLIHLLEASE